MVTHRNHYKLLGVERNESKEGIRRAFRRLAKECHPDCVGPEGEISFKELAQAHEVLSDPEKRHKYDLELAEADSAQVARTRPRWTAPEPIHQRSSFADITLGWSSWRGAPIRDVPISIPRTLEFELILSPEEALRGGQLPLRINLPQNFPTGSGLGASRGAGRLHSQLEALISIPAGIEDGSILNALLRSSPTWGDIDLRIRVRVRR